MEGCYSIAEVVDDSNKHPEKTVFVYLSEIKSEKEIRKLAKLEFEKQFKGEDKNE